MAKLSAFPVTRYYTDDWQSYRKYIPPSEHIVGKAETMENRAKKSQLQNAYQASEPKNDFFSKKRENPRQCDRNVYQSLVFPKRSILGKYLINGFAPAPSAADYLRQQFKFTSHPDAFCVSPTQFESITCYLRWWAKPVDIPSLFL